MIVKTNAQYQEVIGKLLQDKLLSIDSETEEFSKLKTHSFELALDGFGVYSEHVAAYIPAQFFVSGHSAFQKVLDTCTLIFHNAKFDITILEKEGFDVSNLNFHDTMIMSWLLNENRHSFGLKSLAQSVLKVKKEKIVEFRSVKKRPVLDEYGMFPEEYEVDLEKWEKELGMYCISDCRYTYKLYQKFKPQLEEQKLWKVYIDLELPFINVLRNMENRGISLDLNYLNTMGVALDDKLIAFQTEIWKLMGKEIDINSPKQLLEFFMNEKKYEFPDDLKTIKGNFSTDIKSMKYLVSRYNCEIAKNILDYRELFKLRSTYITGMIDRQKRGIIYTSFLQQGTKTGRLSSRNPNLQNLPRRADEFDIRKAFVARPGYTFVISDLSQIEFRLTAFFTKDPILVNAYQNEKDLHQETADALGLKGKEGRNQAKTVNFGILYGRTAYGLSSGLGMSPEEAQVFIDKYFEKFKKIKIFMQQAENTLEHYYAVWTILKRKRRFQDYAQAKKSKDHKLINHTKRQATNSIVQGSAADIIKVQMRNLDRILKTYDSHLLIQVHDELIIEVPVNKADEVLAIVKHEMENAVQLPGIPIVANAQISDRWCK